MDDILMLEMLKNKGGDKAFSEYMKKYFTKNFARGRGRGRGMRDQDFGDFIDSDHYDRDLEMYDDFYINRDSMPGNMEHAMMNKFKHMSHEDKKKFMEMMMGEGGSEHFNEQYAKFTVSNMYHTENGRKYVGEKYDMAKAKEVCERYRGIIPQSATHADVYVAINATYHDYCELYKAWFGDSIDSKIIESSINFWFNDDDWKGGCKIYEYFED